MKITNIRVKVTASVILLLTVSGMLAYRGSSGLSGQVEETGGHEQDASVGLNSNQGSSGTSKISGGSSFIVAPRQQAVISQLQGKGKTYYLSATPNDPYYGSDWALASMNTGAAWDIAKADSDIVIAVLDSGFALQHQDLQASWRINAAEYGGGKESDGIDNDGNGYVDDYLGWDFVATDNSPQAGSTNPSGTGVSHGTEVAGLAGGTTNNGIGIASPAWGASVMPLQVISDDGTGSTASVTPAIYYAVENGADVINMSLGTNGDDPDVRAAVDYAVGQGVIVVAAAGNCGSIGAQGACIDQPLGYVTFPASYEKVVAVGALLQNGQRASFSSYGQRVDIAAPGSGAIVTPTWQQGNQTAAYKNMLHGTSYASPLVSSSAALLRSLRPSTSVDDIRALLMGTANKVASMSGALYTPQYGHGRVNLLQAVTVARDLNTSGEAVPEGYSTGNNQSEASYHTTDILASGCSVPAGTWCTVRLTNGQYHYDRFLPYTLTGLSGYASWSWSGAILDRGAWELRALQGDTIGTTPKHFFRK